METKVENHVELFLRRVGENVSDAYVARLSEHVENIDDENGYENPGFKWEKFPTTVEELVSHILHRFNEPDVIDKGLYKRGLVVLCALGVSGTKLYSLVEDNDCAILLKIMNEHLFSTEVQGLVLDVLCFIAEVDKNDVMLGNLGGITAALNSMTTHMNDTNVHYSGLRLLGLLSSDSNNMNTLVRNSGIEGCIASMKAHRNEDAIQVFGCGLLALIASVEDNRLLIAKKGGIETLVAAMKKHKKIKHIQELAIGALLNLASVHSIKVVIYSCGGIGKIFRAMNRFRCSLRIQRNGMMAAFNLAINGAPVEILQSIADKIDIVLWAMGSQRNCLDMQRTGVVIIFELTHLEGFKNHNAKTALIMALLYAIRNYPGDKGIQACGKRLGEPSRIEKYVTRLCGLLPTNTSAEERICPFSLRCMIHQ
jgi:hypothetical protein